MSLRYWWKDLDKSGSAARNVLSRESFKPLSATIWYSIKSAGILKPTRGKRGRIRPRLMETQLGLDNISIMMLQSTGICISLYGSVTVEQSTKSAIVPKFLIIL